MFRNISFFSIACCPIISIGLNDGLGLGYFGSNVKNLQDVRYISDKIPVSGSFFYNGTINGRDYWLKFGGGLAIWHSPDSQDWIIGRENDIGTTWSIFTRDSKSICPKDFKNDWLALIGQSWYYYNGLNAKWITTNVLELTCKVMGMLLILTSALQIK